MKKKTLKYRMMLAGARLLPLKKLMAQPPEKTQKLFAKAYKGENIPKLSDPKLTISKGTVSGSSVLFIKPKKPTDRLMIYLVGGGMLKYPKPSQVKDVMSLAKECSINVMLPYYPLVLEGHSLTDVYAMLYELYKKALKKFSPENIVFAGGSSGGNLALGLISHINETGEGLPLPAKVYAGSPGSLLITDEEKAAAMKLEKTDVIMSVKATENIWEGMTGGKPVPDYMKYLQLGNYTGLGNVYLSFGGDEVFAAAAESIVARLKECGVEHITMEIGEGMYHSYAMMPPVKDAAEGYRRFREYISHQ